MLVVCYVKFRKNLLEEFRDIFEFPQKGTVEPLGTDTSLTQRPGHNGCPEIFPKYDNAVERDRRKQQRIDNAGQPSAVNSRVLYGNLINQSINQQTLFTLEFTV